MGRHNSHDQLSNKIKTLPKHNPEVMIDIKNDFASIKIKDGIEANSYIKDGILFSEDKKGQIIEIQILNLSLMKRKKKAA